MQPFNVQDDELCSASSSSSSNGDTPMWMQDQTVFLLDWFSLNRTQLVQCTKRYINDLKRWRTRKKQMTASRLKGILKNILAFLHAHILYMDQERLVESELEEDLTTLVSMYIDMELKVWIEKRKTLSKDNVRLEYFERLMAEKLCTWLYSMLTERVQRVDALLDLHMAYVRHCRPILDPILRKVLSDVEQGPLSDETYVRYMLLFKLWREQVLPVEDTVSTSLKMYVINNLVPRNPFSQFDEKLRSCLRPVPPCVTNIPKFHIIASSINLRESCEKFLKCRVQLDKVDTEAISTIDLDFTDVSDDEDEVKLLMKKIEKRKARRLAPIPTSSDPKNLTATTEKTLESFIDLTIDEQDANASQSSLVIDLTEEENPLTELTEYTKRSKDFPCGYRSPTHTYYNQSDENNIGASEQCSKRSNKDLMYDYRSSTQSSFEPCKGCHHHQHVEGDCDMYMSSNQISLIIISCPQRSKNEFKKRLKSRRNKDDYIKSEHMNEDEVDLEEKDSDYNSLSDGVKEELEGHVRFSNNENTLDNSFNRTCNISAPSESVEETCDLSAKTISTDLTQCRRSEPDVFPSTCTPILRCDEMKTTLSTNCVSEKTNFPTSDSVDTNKRTLKTSFLKTVTKKQLCKPVKKIDSSKRRHTLDVSQSSRAGDWENLLDIQSSDSEKLSKSAPCTKSTDVNKNGEKGKSYNEFIDNLLKSCKGNTNVSTAHVQSSKLASSCKVRTDLLEEIDDAPKSNGCAGSDLRNLSELCDVSVETVEVPDKLTRLEKSHAITKQPEIPEDSNKIDEQDILAKVCETTENLASVAILIEDEENKVVDLTEVCDLTQNDLIESNESKVSFEKTPDVVPCITEEKIIETCTEIQEIESENAVTLKNKEDSCQSDITTSEKAEIPISTEEIFAEDNDEKAKEVFRVVSKILSEIVVKIVEEVEKSNVEEIVVQKNEDEIVNLSEECIYEEIVPQEKEALVDENTEGTVNLTEECVIEEVISQEKEVLEVENEVETRTAENTVNLTEECIIEEVVSQEKDVLEDKNEVEVIIAEDTVNLTEEYPIEEVVSQKTEVLEDSCREQVKIIQEDPPQETVTEEERDVPEGTCPVQESSKKEEIKDLSEEAATKETLLQNNEDPSKEDVTKLTEEISTAQEKEAYCEQQINTSKAVTNLTTKEEEVAKLTEEISVVQEIAVSCEQQMNTSEAITNLTTKEADIAKLNEESLTVREKDDSCEQQRQTSEVVTNMTTKEEIVVELKKESFTVKEKEDSCEHQTKTDETITNMTTEVLAQTEKVNSYSEALICSIEKISSPQDKDDFCELQTTSSEEKENSCKQQTNTSRNKTNLIDEISFSQEKDDFCQLQTKCSKDITTILSEEISFLEEKQTSCKQQINTSGDKTNLIDKMSSSQEKDNSCQPETKESEDTTNSVEKISSQEKENSSEKVTETSLDTTNSTEEIVSANKIENTCQQTKTNENIINLIEEISFSQEKESSCQEQSEETMNSAEVVLSVPKDSFQSQIKECDVQIVNLSEECIYEEVVTQEKEVFEDESDAVKVAEDVDNLTEACIIEEVVPQEIEVSQESAMFEDLNRKQVKIILEKIIDLPEKHITEKAKDVIEEACSVKFNTGQEELKDMPEEAVIEETAIQEKEVSSTEEDTTKLADEISPPPEEENSHQKQQIETIELKTNLTKEISSISTESSQSQFEKSELDMQNVVEITDFDKISSKDSLQVEIKQSDKEVTKIMKEKIIKRTEELEQFESVDEEIIKLINSLTEEILAHEIVTGESCQLQTNTTGEKPIKNLEEPIIINDTNVQEEKEKVILQKQEIVAQTELQKDKIEDQVKETTEIEVKLSEEKINEHSKVDRVIEKVNEAQEKSEVIEVEEMCKIDTSKVNEKLANVELVELENKTLDVYKKLKELKVIEDVKVKNVRKRKSRKSVKNNASELKQSLKTLKDDKINLEDNLPTFEIIAVEKLPNKSKVKKVSSKTKVQKITETPEKISTYRMKLRGRKPAFEEPFIEIPSNLKKKTKSVKSIDTVTPQDKVLDANKELKPNKTAVKTVSRSNKIQKEVSNDKIDGITELDNLLSDKKMTNKEGEKLSKDETKKSEPLVNVSKLESKEAVQVIPVSSTSKDIVEPKSQVESNPLEVSELYICKTTLEQKNIKNSQISIQNVDTNENKIILRLIPLQKLTKISACKKSKDKSYKNLNKYLKSHVNTDKSVFLESPKRKLENDKKVNTNVVNSKPLFPGDVSANDYFANLELMRVPKKPAITDTLIVEPNSVQVEKSQPNQSDVHTVMRHCKNSRPYVLCKKSNEMEQKIRKKMTQVNHRKPKMKSKSKKLKLSVPTESITTCSKIICADSESNNAAVSNVNEDLSKLENLAKTPKKVRAKRQTKNPSINSEIIAPVIETEIIPPTQEEAEAPSDTQPVIPFKDITLEETTIPNEVEIVTDEIHVATVTEQYAEQREEFFEEMCVFPLIIDEPQPELCYASPKFEETYSVQVHTLEIYESITVVAPLNQTVNPVFVKYRINGSCKVNSPVMTYYATSIDCCYEEPPMENTTEFVSNYDKYRTEQCKQTEEPKHHDFSLVKVNKAVEGTPSVTVPESKNLEMLTNIAVDLPYMDCHETNDPSLPTGIISYYSEGYVPDLYSTSQAYSDTSCKKNKAPDVNTKVNSQSETEIRNKEISLENKVQELTEAAKKKVCTDPKILPSFMSYFVPQPQEFEQYNLQLSPKIFDDTPFPLTLNELPLSSDINKKAAEIIALEPIISSFNKPELKLDSKKDPLKCPEPILSDDSLVTLEEKPGGRVRTRSTSVQKDLKFYNSAQSMATSRRTRSSDKLEPNLPKIISMSTPLSRYKKQEKQTKINEANMKTSPNNSTSYNIRHTRPLKVAPGKRKNAPLHFDEPISTKKSKIDEDFNKLLKEHLESERKKLEQSNLKKTDKTEPKKEEEKQCKDDKKPSACCDEVRTSSVIKETKSVNSEAINSTVPEKESSMQTVQPGRSLTIIEEKAEVKEETPPIINTTVVSSELKVPIPAANLPQVIESTEVSLPQTSLLTEPDILPFTNNENQLREIEIVQMNVTLIMEQKENMLEDIKPHKRNLTPDSGIVLESSNVCSNMDDSTKYLNLDSIGCVITGNTQQVVDVIADESLSSPFSDEITLPPEEPERVMVQIELNQLPDLAPMLRKRKRKDTYVDMEHFTMSQIIYKEHTGRRRMQVENGDAELVEVQDLQHKVQTKGAKKEYPGGYECSMDFLVTHQSSTVMDSQNKSNECAPDYDTPSTQYDDDFPLIAARMADVQPKKPVNKNTELRYASRLLPSNDMRAVLEMDEYSRKKVRVENVEQVKRYHYDGDKDHFYSMEINRPPFPFKKSGRIESRMENVQSKKRVSENAKDIKQFGNEILFSNSVEVKQTTLMQLSSTAIPPNRTSHSRMLSDSYNKNNTWFDNPNLKDVLARFSQVDHPSVPQFEIMPKERSE